MEATDSRRRIDIKAIERAFKERLKNTSIKFDVHRVIYDTDFFVHFKYRPLTQVPFGPFIPLSVMEEYDTYSVAAYVDKKSTQHIDIHFRLNTRDK
ncbi:MAG: hypothetical protein U9N61_02165 [Euryarchaeota archaeon]|nr:hypothetical protein [Euryarchaeota archaeon]